MVSFFVNTLQSFPPDVDLSAGLTQRNAILRYGARSDVLIVAKEDLITLTQFNEKTSDLKI